MSTRPLIRESLMILNAVGLNPTNQNTKSKFLIVLQVILYGHLGTELTLQVAFNWKDLNSIDGVTALSMVYQAFTRILVIVFQSDILRNVLNRIGEFWLYDKKCSHTLQTEIKNIHLMARKCFKIYNVILLVTTTFYIGRTFFTTTRSLPFETYHPLNRSKSPQYQIMYITECLELIPGTCCLVGFDCLFISLIIYIIGELKMLKEEFNNINVTLYNEVRNLEKIKILVNRHNLILKCIKDISKTYSLLLLNQFFCSMIGICAGLVSMIANGFPPDLQHLLKYATFITTILSQLFIYCSAGTYLISESESVSLAVYHSDWWLKTQPEVRRAYVLVIQRANKAERLTAGGMFTLNLESFTSIVRTSLSFFTLVQAMYTRFQ